MTTAAPPAAVVELPTTALGPHQEEAKGAAQQSEQAATPQTCEEEADDVQADEKGSKKKSKKKNFKTSTGGKGRSGALVDVLSEVAQHNAHYTCHGVQNLLACRGYPWPLGQSSKKKK